MVPESDWKLFCIEWDGDEEKGISAQVVPLTRKEAKSNQGFLPDSDIDSRSPHGQASSELEPKDLAIKTDPEVSRRRLVSSFYPRVHESKIYAHFGPTVF